jgi:hypothetical protein
MTAPLTAYQNEKGKICVMSKKVAVDKLREMVVAVGIDDAKDFAFHSGRAGGATKLYLAGASDREIQTAGRWKSMAFLEYIRNTDEEGVKISRMLMC